MERSRSIDSTIKRLPMQTLRFGLTKSEQKFIESMIKPME